MLNFIKRKYLQAHKWLWFYPPGAMSMAAWADFNREFKEKAPIRFWFTHVLRRSVYSLKHRFFDAVEWVKYRTVKRMHILHTGLKPGYQEISDILLHTNFGVLKTFVETELAETYAIRNSLISKNQKPTKPSLIKRVFPSLFYSISPEQGLAYLNWAETLDDPTLPLHEQAADHAVSAREIKELYLWWTSARPNRKETTLQYKDTDTPYERMKSLEDRTKERDAHRAEDTEMLVRLVKIMHLLWV